MRGLPDNNADGVEGTIPYKYLYFFRFIFLGRVEEERSSSAGRSGCIVSRGV